ncbi:MAG: GTP pyrophosphokinase family protein [Clostridiales bacterium]|nr:GTP pyrophosphokinase family protein [Clostridiales bacterium]
MNEITMPAKLPAKVMEMFKKSFKNYEELMAYYSCAIMEIETKFNVLNKQFSLTQEYNPIETIKSRLKSPESILEKMQRKGYPMSAESIEMNMHDVAGIRVICPFISDIYMLADCLLKQDDVYLIEKKDYIEKPKENGYRSLHLIVETPIFLKNEKKMMKVEVQLRTIAMDFWASLEHRMSYKKQISPVLVKELKKELKECADISAAQDKRMQLVRDKINSEY